VRYLNRGIEPRPGQTKDYKIGICCFSTKHAPLRRKSKDWLALNQNNVSEWRTCLPADCYFSELALHFLYKNPTQHVGLVQSGPHHHFIEINLFPPWYSWKIDELVLNNNYLLTHSLTHSKPFYYYTGSRFGQMLLARLRMQCSSLNQHWYRKNIVDSPNITVHLYLWFNWIYYPLFIPLFKIHCTKINAHTLYQCINKPDNRNTSFWFTENVHPIKTLNYF
jgi:hypothetical protein